MIRLVSATWLILCCAVPYAQSPNPRHLEEIVFDQGRNKVIVFGGVEINSSGFTEPSDISEWDGAEWKIIDEKGPVGRRGHALVYDEVEQKVLLIGGVTQTQKGDSALFDVWKWNGFKWNDAGSECPVKEPVAVYDPLQKRVLIYGELINKKEVTTGDERKFELWQYKSGNWKKLSSAGPATQGRWPIAFDISRQSLVIPILENGKVEIWEWRENFWEMKTCKGDCPLNRNRFALAYHPIDKQIFLFGGFSADRKQLGDFWKWNGNVWKKIESSEGPSVRNSAHFVYSGDQLVLYGGSIPKKPPLTGIEASNELWIWKNNSWKQLK